jgi:hypothetical protein
VKRLFLAATIGCGLGAILKALQVGLTPEAWSALAGFGRRLLGSSAVGLLLAGTAILFLLSLCAAAWDRAERRWEGADEARAELAAKGFATFQDHVDTSSLLDDSPTPLPDSWRAPCGEVARGWHRCATCGRSVVRESCGEPWARGRVAIGYHLGCGHGRACHAAPSSVSVSHQTDSGLPAA